MADLPLWISSEQVDRLKAAIEALGFEGVSVKRMTSLDDLGIPDDRIEVKALHTASGDRNHAVIGNARGLDMAVERFRQFKGRRD